VGARVDVALPLRPDARAALSLGVYQFF
jgi:hypothetical protein